MISTLNSLLSAKSINRPIINNEKKIIELLNTKYSIAFESFNSGSVLYRGIRSITDNDDLFIASEYLPVKRVSSDSANIINYFMSELLPSWKDYPKRSEGVVCTNSLRYAEHFAGNDDRVYFVFPENGANLGICPTNDIWSSFKKNNIVINEDSFSIGYLDTLLLYFFAICNIISMPNTALSINSVNNEKLNVRNNFKQFNKEYISKCILNCNKIINNNLYNIEECDYYPVYIRSTDFINKVIKYGNIILAIDDILDTDRNGFNTMRLNYVMPCLSYDSEVWTDSVCLLVKYTDIYRIIHEYME